MKFSQIFSAVAIISTAAAVPQGWSNWGGWGGNKNNCITQAQADDIVAKFITILNHPNVPAANATAQALLSDKFTEVSDSILSLQGLPLGGDSFPEKQDYINGVLNAPPVEGIHTIETLPAGCSKIIWYWNFTGIGSAKYEVKGFNLFTIANSQIEAINVEFNSIAWGLDYGYQVIFPSY